MFQAHTGEPMITRSYFDGSFLTGSISVDFALLPSLAATN
jgi:hypothetical protein